MPKFIVRGDKPKEEIVEFWLKAMTNGDVALIAACGKEERYIALIGANGILYRSASSTCIPGLQYDDKGRIREME